ncbi:MAG: peptidoglycan DD-metalloendopeptidase family protein [Bacteroidetes bacterium]|nr:peptidoglycan DD-metalloendopeptidase family protein [Bacteroidota bacterium]MBP7399688.1 peptidoglycan DD-metalloendopeptidase family protein [Chitinophagales bacterium]MBP8754886.1 peptidoglycan DD-metalloendopeptidase family protein [Chitinophagales bacterium]MBP9190473.1 peptidoglycan DD-metalloendopeptidase family protein [Chitinophagales bacterium]MBP9548714.1 peptidoglycan DD-metalloendopeptidase family protein [Chitinophagales bacterium]
MKWYTKLFFFAFLLMSASVFSQTTDKKSLETKYTKLQSEIKDTEHLLEQTKKKKQNSLNEVKLLNSQINVRQEMISNIALQVGAVSKEMQETAGVINSMEKDIQGMRDQYAKMITYAYVNDNNYEPLHFIFASGSMNDAINEIQYVKEFTAFRKQQAAAIKAVQAALQSRIDQLESDKTKKEDLLQSEKQQKQKLDKEKSAKDNSVKSLQKEEKKINDQLKQKKKDADALNKKIQSIIAEEIRKEKERAAAEAAKKAAAEKKASTTTAAEKTTAEKATTTEAVGLTPEMALVSKNFEGNKGRLPWPVERGTITERFGTHAHPVLKNVSIENNGINISTTEGASVRAIFEGEVLNVIFSPSFQKGIIIKHGEYYTVYTNLASVSVEPGAKVSAKQKIGTVYTNSEEGKTDVHLELWKGTTLLDPALWISK